MTVLATLQDATVRGMMATLDQTFDGLFHAETTMTRLPQIAVATQAFNQPLRRSLQQAAELRADGVQFDVGRELHFAEMTESACRHLLREMREYDLKVAALNLPVNRPLSDWQVLESHLDQIKQAMQLAFRLRCGVVTFRVGKLPAVESPEFATLAAVLNESARYANHIGASPSIAVSASSIAEIVALFDLITDGPIGMNLDPAVLVASGLSPSNVFRELVHTVNHILVRDAVTDLEGTFVEVPVGRGNVVWDELLALTQEADYRGWLTVIRTQGDDKPGDLARAVRFLRTVSAE